MLVFVLNAGSSSLKYQLIDAKTQELKANGLVERIGIDGILKQVIDENRKIITRQIEGIHRISENAIEVTKETFDTSIMENHNYLNEDLTTCIKDVRTVEEIAEYETQKELVEANKLIELYENLLRLGLV